MGRVNDDNWLDEALAGAFHCDDTQPDFEAWKTQYPEAVEELTARRSASPAPRLMRSIKMNSVFVKLAVAAVVTIAAVIGAVTGIYRHAWPYGEAVPLPEIEVYPERLSVKGPATRTFNDGSVVTLAEGAEIRYYAQDDSRGFEHLTGTVNVTVAKGQGEFIVTTPYGDVKALGTEFTLELVDGTADSGQKVELLAVEVTEGKVEVSNALGRTTLEANQDTIVVKDAPPYDFNQDEALPDRLKERIAAMVAAFAAGDAAAWAANFNMNYVFKLGKGQVPYDPLRFGGSAEDAQRLGEMIKDIESPEQLSQVFLHTINITEPMKIYVRSVALSDDGQHAQAECIRRKSERSMTRTTPQWHYFDNDWWQIDD